MRDDMKEVLRLCRWYDPWGGGDTSWKGDPEDAPIKERMRTKRSKFRSGGITGPLKKYLAKQIGRSWDMVWSDICEVADSRGDSGRRMREAVFWNVEEHVVMEDGSPYRRYARWSRDPYRYYGLYIHPETGILEESKYEERHKEKKPLTNFVLNGCIYEKTDGFWYEVWYEPKWYAIALRVADEYVYKKRQLSAKELRDLGIKNDNQK